VAIIDNSWRYLTIGVALAFSLLSGWGVLHVVPVLEYMGFVGVMAMVMVTGPHGGGAIGGVVFIIVNTVTYYLLIRTFVYFRKFLSIRRSH
jgi:hypothetical protein